MYSYCISLIFKKIVFIVTNQSDTNNEDKETSHSTNKSTIANIFEREHPNMKTNKRMIRCVIFRGQKKQYPPKQNQQNHSDPLDFFVPIPIILSMPNNVLCTGCVELCGQRNKGIHPIPI